MTQTLITAALPYVNSFLHLGHLAGAYLPADMYARFLRLSGRKVLFVCGSDEHGVAITISADKEHTTPDKIIDKYHFANKQAFEQFGMSFDIFSRTSLPEHAETAQEFFLDWLKKGLLVEKEENQFYDEEAHMFLPDRYVEGTCPNCGNEHARGDQCDNCSANYNQTDLINPKSVVSGKTPVVRSTKHWYFKMGDFQERLENYIESNASKWKDNVLQQSRSWLKQGLADRAATRDMTWGIPVPVEGAKGKVIYVWFEAVLGYISATKEWAKLHNNPEEWKDWWQNQDTEYIAFLGKDNIVFHTLIFPMLLMAKENYILPANVPANEFMNFEGKKFSKSMNWGIFLHDYQRDFPSPSQTDSLRYTIAMNLPETKDSDFTWQDLQARNNNELAAIFGNFVNRVVQFLHKNFDGKVPALPERFVKLNDAWKLLLEDFGREDSKELAFEKYESKHLRYFSPNDVALIAAIHFGAKKAAEHYARFRFRDAVSETMNIARAANKYFNDAAPWKTVKTDNDDCAKTLYICSQAIGALSTLFAPILPNTCAALAKMIGIESNTGEPDLEILDRWSTAAFPAIAELTPMASPEVLFAKIEDSTITEQVERMNPTTQTTLPETEPTDIITIDDFKRIKLRTAIVEKAERVPKSEKLLKLQVNLGNEIRQIIAGIAKFYTPEEMVGKTVVVVANLQAAKLMGMESQGMLLAANTPEGTLALVTPESTVSAGSEVR
ncbi:MAG: methionine--tRNA ligase [Ignavibacteriae bacterium]|nr:methionine--tRNA ligase [Ignavibacteriota bacterium]